MYSTPKVQSGGLSKTMKYKNKKINYGNYWSPIHKIIIKLYETYHIPFVDDFIEIIDSDGIVHGGEDILAIADLEIDIYTNYLRFYEKCKYIYIDAKYIVFRKYVINVNNLHYKPIDLATFESAHILMCFTQLHNH
jgi:hypothetical protein